MTKLPLWLSLSVATLLTLSTTLAAKQLTPTDTHAILNASKHLCWGCVGDALQFLYAHNLARAAKWELPLLWDPQLAQHAATWANLRRADCAVQHSPEEAAGTLGENIFWGGGSTWTAVDAVSAWTDEERFYDYVANVCQVGEQCGHYTQVVWRRTRRLGCARVVCDGGDVFIACNYDPPGNYVGQKPY